MAVCRCGSAAAQGASPTPYPPARPVLDVQVVGDSLRPHLQPLSASQLRLLDIFIGKARAAAA